MSPQLPTPRGALSRALIEAWTRGEPVPLPDPLRGDPLTDDDLQLALWCCYQLHYGGFEGIHDSIEWDLDTLAFRRVLEAQVEEALRSEHRAGQLPEDPSIALRVIARWASPPLARTMEESGERWQLEEFAIHRSAYQLKEADGHTWGIPRLSGPARSAMIEIQTDEYGGGRPGMAHSELFAAAMDELGLDPTFGAYIDRLPGVTLATDNLVSFFGLHRRNRGALVGHLALFESTSVVPMGRYLSAARRLGGMPALARFYEVHVEADAHHSVLALDTMVTTLCESEPDLAGDVIFGAAALARTETRFAHHLLSCWSDGRSSLLDEADLCAPAARSGVDVDLTLIGSSDVVVAGADPIVAPVTAEPSAPPGVAPSPVPEAAMGSGVAVLAVDR